MIDYETAQRLSYILTEAIENGMKNGAAHIAEALAKPKVTPGSVDELLDACKVLVMSNTSKQQDGFDLMIGKTGAFDVNTQLDAWRTLRRALGMPT